MEFFKAGIRSGIMFFAAVVVLGFLVVSVGGGRMFEKGLEYRILFPAIGDLDTESPVTYAGYEVGKVSNIRVLSQNEMIEVPGYFIEVLVLVNKEVSIQKDTEITIKSLGFMGQKYVDFGPGSMEAGVALTSDVLKGSQPRDMNFIVEKLGGELDVLFPRIRSIVQNVDDTINDLESIVKDVKDKEQVKRVLEGLQKAVVTFQKSLDNLEGILNENKSDIRKAVAAISTAASNLEGILIENRPDIRDAVEELKDILEENRPNIKQITDKIKVITGIVKEFVIEIKKNPWKLLHKPRSARRGSASEENDKRKRRR